MINIHRIEVASDDPDRFVHDLGELASSALKNPGTARSAIRGF